MLRLSLKFEFIFRMTLKDWGLLVENKTETNAKQNKSEIIRILFEVQIIMETVTSPKE